MGERSWYYEHRAPGVYLEKEFRLAREEVFETGVPAFLGPAPVHPKYVPRMLMLWSHFELYVGDSEKGEDRRWCSDSYLAYAVRGFFKNGGRRCYVVPLEDNSASSLEKGLKAIASMSTIDLVCAPDLVKDKKGMFELQQILVNHCEGPEAVNKPGQDPSVRSEGDRFAVLDSQLDDSPVQVCEQWWNVDGKNGALYYPWVKVEAFSGGFVLVPPCGHVAGVYARTDRLRGVHKAPANEVLEGVVGLERVLTKADQDHLNPRRVNCLLSFPGRGIRVYGARTLSNQEPWTYVTVRRLFLTAIRWINWNMSDIPFEPNDPKLWARIERELSTYFTDQFRAGALKGRTRDEAFFVKCNTETNPPELRERGEVVTEIGLAPTIPYEFVVVRLIHGARGVTISGPTRPEQLS